MYLVQSNSSFTGNLSIDVKNLVQYINEDVCLGAVNKFYLSFNWRQLMPQIPQYVEIAIGALILNSGQDASVGFVVFQNVVYHVAKDPWFLN